MTPIARRGAGDPLEIALLSYAGKHGTDASGLTVSRPRLSSLPFDSINKFMRVTVDEGGRPVSYLKGAPEVLIERSPLCPWKSGLGEKALAHAREGFRVLARLARTGERHEGRRRHHFPGLVMLWDPPRPEVPEALQLAKAAGIRVLMITGDHPATAEAVGVPSASPRARVLTGEDRTGSSRPHWPPPCRGQHLRAVSRPSRSCGLSRR